MVNFSFGPIQFLPFAIFGILFVFFHQCHATVVVPLSMKGAAPFVSSGSKKQFASSSFKSNSSYGNDVKNSMGMGGSKNILQMAPKLDNIQPLSIRHSSMRPISAIPLKHSAVKSMVEDANGNYKGDWATMEMEKREERLYKGLYGENVEEDRQKEGEWHHLSAAFDQLPPYAQDRIAELALPTCIALEMLSELTALKTEYRTKNQHSKDNNPSFGVAHLIIPDQFVYAKKMMNIFDHSIKQIYPHLDHDNDNLLTNVSKIFADAAEFCRLFLETEPMEFMRYYFDDIEDELQNRELLALLEKRKVQMENIHKWLQKMIEYLANYEDKDKSSAIFVSLVQETSPIPPTSPPRRRTI